MYASRQSYDSNFGQTLPAATTTPELLAVGRVRGPIGADANCGRPEWLGTAQAPSAYQRKADAVGFQQSYLDSRSLDPGWTWSARSQSRSQSRHCIDL